MAAIITDQIRILNAKNFVSGVSSSVNSYYAFVGLPNPTSISDDWNDSPPSPTDNLNRHNAYWDTVITASYNQTNRTRGIAFCARTT